MSKPRKPRIPIDRASTYAEVLLKTPLILPQIGINDPQTRTHDDCDGVTEEALTVTMSADGDMWIQITSRDGRSHGLRFRNYGGGGNSLRTHNALRILALAIHLDNTEVHPYL